MSNHAAQSSETIFPTSKHNRPPPPSHIPLHGLDPLSAPIQIRNHRFYTAPPSTFGPNLFEKLKASLAEALELFPAAAGTMNFKGDGQGALIMDPKEWVGTPYITEVRAEPFAGDEESLAPRTAHLLLPPSPALAVKITQFSCGTVVVASSFHHQVADLAGFVDFLEVWAQITRGEPIDFTHIPDDWTHTPGRFFSDIQSDPSFIPPGFKVLATPALGPATYLLSPSEATRWVIKKPALEKLKQDFSPSTGNRGDWISTGDALTALICSTISRARHLAKIERQEGRSPESATTEVICSAADGRERAPRGDMQGKYFGNFNPLFFTVASRADLIASDNAALSRVALAIRKALNDQLSPQSLANKIAFFENTDNNSPPGRIDWSADLIVTNWCKFNLEGPKMDFGWGQPFEATFGGGGPYPPGYSVITQKKTGDVHVLMAVEKEAGEALRSDQVLNRYGNFVTII